MEETKVIPEPAQKEIFKIKKAFFKPQRAKVDKEIELMSIYDKDYERQASNLFKQSMAQTDGLSVKIKRESSLSLL